MSSPSHLCLEPIWHGEPPIIHAVRTAILGGPSPLTPGDAGEPARVDGTGSTRSEAASLMGSESAGGLDLIIIIDGLGRIALDEFRSYTPRLRQLSEQTTTVRTLAPSTTATVLTSLLTGRSPLEHGVLGYTVFADRSSTRTVGQLTGDPSIDPAAWMPLQNLGQQAIASGRSAAQVGPARYAGSFLSSVMQRDWAFVQQRTVHHRVRAVESALHRAGDNGVVYLHLAEVDKAGHHAGPGSDPWRAALEDVDQLVGTLVRRLSDRVRLTITADHGMMPTSRAEVLDLAEQPIGAAITAVSGEPRALSVRSAHSEGELVERLQSAVGERGLVMGRSDLIASGLLGSAEALSEHAAERLGDAIIWARGATALTHSGFIADAVLDQRGMHGSLTDEEMLVPLIQLGG